MTRKKSGYSRKAALTGKPFKRKALTKQLAAIRKEFLARKQADAQSIKRIPFQDRPDAFLKREIYWLGKQVLRGPKKAWKPDKLIAGVRAKRITRPEKQLEVFAALISSVFPDDTLSRNARSQWPRELNFAFGHKVPAKYLCGFLMQAGPERVLKARMEKEKIGAPAWPPAAPYADDEHGME